MTVTSLARDLMLMQDSSRETRRRMSEKIAAIRKFFMVSQGGLHREFYQCHYCNTPEAPIWMADLSFRSLGDIQVGDEVMGWGHDGFVRRSLLKSTVLGVTRRWADIVRVTMESGQVIRCTPDHLWAGGRHWMRGSRYPTYESAIVGRDLVRLIQPTEPLIGEDAGLARWLGGIYDGEGTSSWICQSRTQNPDVCKRIEEALDRMGLEYSERDNGAGCSLFNILGGRQAYVDFVNLAKPVRTEWFEQRVMHQARAKLDRVVSIEFESVGEVISMTTETGNYVAWGYASKNCDEWVPKEQMTIDHIVPWSVCRITALWNSAFVCKTCNEMKGNEIDWCICDRCQFARDKWEEIRVAA